MKKCSALLASSLAIVLTLTACGGANTSAPAGTQTTKPDSGAAAPQETNTGEAQAIREYTAYFAVPGAEINNDNEVQALLTKLTGARAKETWLTGQTAQEAVGVLIAGGEYPDLIDGSDGTGQLVEAGALIPLDDYIPKYPYINEFYTAAEWDKIRSGDGHIYIIPQFNNVYEKDMAAEHNDEAFWIQTRVLKWDNFPKITTPDEYFDLIERYNAANPAMADGTPNIPFTVLSEDWRYFCLENPPQFLDGYPNDGSVLVDVAAKKVMDYNTTPTAKQYFQKLNDEFKKGIVDPESFTQTYDEYIAKMSTGRILGFVDQFWDFQTARDAIAQQGLAEQGCNYVPLPLVIKEGITPQYRATNPSGTLNVANGLGVSVSCKDPEGALQLINDLLSPEARALRMWGEKDVDYKVGDDGLFYRTEEMRQSASNATYKAEHLCSYSYFPQYTGMLPDGINAEKPTEQPQEFFDSLASDLKECFAAYGYTTYIDWVGTHPEPGPWYPMYSHSNTMTTSTSGGTAWIKMGETKHEWLPRVVMSDDFASAWTEYMAAYNACKPEDFLAEMQTELDRRIALAESAS